MQSTVKQKTEETHARTHNCNAVKIDGIWQIGKSRRLWMQISRNLRCAGTQETEFRYTKCASTFAHSVNTSNNRNRKFRWRCTEQTTKHEQTCHGQRAVLRSIHADTVILANFQISLSISFRANFRRVFLALVARTRERLRSRWCATSIGDSEVPSNEEGKRTRRDWNAITCNGIEISWVSYLSLFSGMPRSIQQISWNWSNMVHQTNKQTSMQTHKQASTSICYNERKLERIAKFDQNEHQELPSSN